jgi:hypothetical protein
LLMSSKKTLTEIPYKAVLDTFENIPTEQFTGAHPFPHIVLDGLFDGDTVKEIHKQFRELPSDYWQKNNDQGIEVKWRSNWSSEYDIPQPAREMVQFLNSGIFLRELSRLTGIPHLIPDPYYTGGGFNLIQRGGYLDVHADGNWHDAMEVHRRLNLILYLNSDWQEEWGGALNFYDADARVAPRSSCTTTPPRRGPATRSPKSARTARSGAARAGPTSGVRRAAPRLGAGPDLRDRPREPPRGAPSFQGSSRVASEAPRGSLGPRQSKLG